ncbi:MAG: branched-chain amino acid ABC transporter permease [Acetobacteraceae bacterium]|nr:branched-chain amino acid ABC transporter permease [Acetobacteraceae bacterium]
MFFLALVVSGLLAGAVYALIALSFVVIYRSSRMINFAAGEWVTVGSLMTATGLHVLSLGLAASIALACAGMIALAWGFSELVLRRLAGRSLISMIMITLGLGALMRGSAAMVFKGVPGTISLPVPEEPLLVLGLIVPLDKLTAAAIAAACIAVVHWFHQSCRTGLALRAISGDQALAAAMGIDVQRHFTFVWAMAAVIAVIAGVLWTSVAGGGFGSALVGLKIFPIVIIGGLDSIRGTIAGAMIVGVLESLTTGYVDTLLGGGFGTIASSLVLIGMLFARPYGLFGRANTKRV